MSLRSVHTWTCDKCGKSEENNRRPDEWHLVHLSIDGNMNRNDEEVFHVCDTCFPRHKMEPEKRRQRNAGVFSWLASKW